MPPCNPAPTPAQPAAQPPAYNVTFLSVGSHGLAAEIRLRSLLRTALRAHGLRAAVIQPATPAGKPLGDPLPLPEA